MQVAGSRQPDYRPTDRTHQPDAVALHTARRDAAKVARPQAHQLLHQLRVPVVGAGGQHYGALEHHRSLGALRTHSMDPAVRIPQQFGHRVLQPDVDVVVLQRLGQKTAEHARTEGQRVAFFSRWPGLVVGVLGHAKTLHGRTLAAGHVVVQPGQAPALQEHVRVGGADRKIRAHAHLAAPGAQHLAVDHFVGQVPSRQLRARSLVVIVGQSGNGGPADRAHVFPMLDGHRRDLEPTQHGRLIEIFRMVMRDVANVLLGEIQGVGGDSLTPGDMVVADPHLAAGKGRRAAHHVRGFQHHDLEPVHRRTQGGCDTRQTRTHDHQGFGHLFCLRLHVPSLAPCPAGFRLVICACLAAVRHKSAALQGSWPQPVCRTHGCAPAFPWPWRSPLH